LGAEFTDKFHSLCAMFPGEVLGDFEAATLAGSVPEINTCGL
jgi:hypothetical protein